MRPAVPHAVERTVASGTAERRSRVALGFARGFDAGLAELDALRSEPQLAGYGYLEAARADLLARLGRIEEAHGAYEEAVLLTGNAAERRLLVQKLDALGRPPA